MKLFNRKKSTPPPTEVICARCGSPTWAETRVSLNGLWYHATCLSQIVRGRHPAVDFDKALGE